MVKNILLALIFISGFCSAQNNCPGVSATSDKFTGDITYTTPFWWGMMNRSTVVFEKVIHMNDSLKNKSDTLYFMMLSTYGLTLNVGTKGIIILFDDKSKMEFPDAKIESRAVEGDGWGYDAFVMLTKEQVDILSAKRIASFRLYIYPQDVPKKNGEKMREYMECMKSA